MSRILVAYFSASGVTERAAKQLAEAASADLYEIAPKDMYTSAELNWMDKNSRSTLEMKDPAARPALESTSADFSQYDVVYLGFPVWWQVAPRIINTFLETYDFSGKTIALFGTSGGSGMAQATKALKEEYPELKIAGGKLLRGRVTGDELAELV